MILIQQANQSFLFLSLGPVFTNFPSFSTHYHFVTVASRYFWLVFLFEVCTTSIYNLVVECFERCGQARVSQQVLTCGGEAKFMQ